MRPKPTSSLLRVVTRLRGQGDLSGEQFDKLYRFYREVFAKVCLCNWARLAKPAVKPRVHTLT